jgi:hypothetical protein
MFASSLAKITQLFHDCGIKLTSCSYGKSNRKHFFVSLCSELKKCIVEEEKGIKPKKGGGNKVEADLPSRVVGDNAEPLTESLVVTGEPQSTHNNLNPNHAKMDPAVTENVELEKEAVDSGVIPKDDVNMKTVIEADPPSRVVGDKVEPLTEELVVTAEPQSTHNNLNPDHAKIVPLLLAKEIPAVTEKVEFEKEAVDGGIITKDDVNVKTVVEADLPSREVGDKVEPLAKLLVVTAEPQSTHNNLNPNHAKMEPLLLESDIPANTLEAQLETSIVDNGVPAKADGNIKTESEVESPSSNIGDAI